jgi:hypothetical protein
VVCEGSVGTDAALDDAAIFGCIACADWAEGVSGFSLSEPRQPTMGNVAIPAMNVRLECGAGMKGPPEIDAKPRTWSKRRAQPRDASRERRVGSRFQRRAPMKRGRLSVARFVSSPLVVRIATGSWHLRLLWRDESAVPPRK